MLKNKRLATILAVVTASLAGIAGYFVAPSAAAQVIMNTIASNHSIKDDGSIQIVSASASSTVHFSMKYNYIGTWVLAVAPIKKVHGRPACFWASGTWTNSVKTPVVKAYRETSRAKFCMLAHPVVINHVRYTAVKVAGGKTGMPCRNWAVPPNQPQPKPQIIGPVYDVKSLTSVKIPLNVNAHSNASVSGLRKCPGGSLSGTASGAGSIMGRFYATISASLLLKSKGKVTASIKNVVYQQLKLAVEGRATSNATARLSIVCGAAPPPVTTTVPGTTTNVTTNVTTNITTTTSTTTTSTPPPSVSITGFTTLNLVPAGQPSGTQFVSVNASDPGTITVDGGLGSVSDCNGGSRKSSVDLPLSSGNNSVCYYYYAPNDADQPPTDTITYTAIVKTAGGTAKDVKSQTFKIQYPTRA